MQLPPGLKKEWLEIAEKLSTGPTAEELKSRADELSRAIADGNLAMLHELGIHARVDTTKDIIGLALNDSCTNHLRRLGPERGRLLLAGISIQACLLRQIPNPPIRAAIVHAILEACNQAYRRLHPENVITCHKGCSFCCHIKVSITEDEAMLLMTKPLTKRQLTRAKLQRMGSDTMDEATFIKQPLDARRCVYLDDKGECTTYYTRPSVCRNHHSIDPPEKCDTTSNSDGQVRYTTLMDADILLAAHWQVSPPGAMATQLLTQTTGHK